MAVALAFQGTTGFGCQRIPGTDQGMLMFKDEETGIAAMIPTNREVALAWAVEIQRAFSGIEVATSMPKFKDNHPNHMPPPAHPA